jgi:hypothetical protein
VNAHPRWPGSLPRAARQCRPLSRAGGAFRRWSPGRAPSRVPAPEPCSRWPTGAGAARVHRDSRPRLDLSPRRFRGLLLAACASTTSADRCFNEHDDGPLEHPGRGVRGRDGRRIDRSLPLDRRRPPKVLRVRGRGSPSLDAPSRDCSRERLRPGPDCFRHLASRALPVRPVRSRRGRRAKPPALQALARRAQRQGGKIDRFPRRNPTITGPR